MFSKSNKTSYIKMEIDKRKQQIKQELLLQGFQASDLLDEKIETSLEIFSMPRKVWMTPESIENGLDELDFEVPHEKTEIQNEQHYLIEQRKLLLALPQSELVALYWQELELREMKLAQRCQRIELAKEQLKKTRLARLNKYNERRELLWEEDEKPQIIKEIKAKLQEEKIALSQVIDVCTDDENEFNEVGFPWPRHCQAL